MTEKERKRTHSAILHDALYHLPQHLPFKWPPNNHEQPRLQTVLVRPV